MYVCVFMYVCASSFASKLLGQSSSPLSILACKLLGKASMPLDHVSRPLDWAPVLLSPAPTPLGGTSQPSRCLS